MTPKKRDAIERNYAVGRQAENILEGIGSLHQERETQLLDTLLNWFDSNAWDDRVAVRYIAALSENRQQKITLEYRAEKGRQARAKLFQGTTNTTAEE